MDISPHLPAEQISVDITEVSTNSATVTLSCGLNETGALQFMLNAQSLSLICGRTNLTDLMPNVDYVLYRRYQEYQFNPIMCSLGNFTSKLQNCMCMCM